MIKRIFGVLFAVVLLFFVCIVFPPIAASAEESTETTQETPAEPQEQTTEQEPDASEETAQEPTEETQEGVENIVQEFIAQLKEQYGEQWQQYYDAILGEWGTVENYLLSLIPDDSPDVVKDGWTKFVDWTRDNWVILAAIGATIAVVIIIVFGRKLLKLIIEFFKSLFAKVSKIFTAINTIYKNAKAQNDALIKLMGDNPKFSEEKENLKKSGEEMMKEELVKNG